jgi:hypothetical protein
MVIMMNSEFQLHVSLVDDSIVHALKVVNVKECVTGLTAHYHQFIDNEYCLLVKSTSPICQDGDYIVSRKIGHYEFMSSSQFKRLQYQLIPSEPEHLGVALHKSRQQINQLNIRIDESETELITAKVEVIYLRELLENMSLPSIESKVTNIDVEPQVTPTVDHGVSVNDLHNAKKTAEAEMLALKAKNETNPSARDILLAKSNLASLDVKRG